MSKIKIDWAKVDSIKADFAKGDVKVTLRMSLDTGLEIRDALADIANGDQPITVEIKPWQSKLPFMESVTVSVGQNHGGGKDDSNGDAKAD